MNQADQLVRIILLILWFSDSLHHCHLLIDKELTTIDIRW